MWPVLPKVSGMNVEALDVFVPDAAIEAEGVKPLHDVNELFSQNQFVSLHIPATPQTKVPDWLRPRYAYA